MARTVNDLSGPSFGNLAKAVGVGLLVSCVINAGLMVHQGNQELRDKRLKNDVYNSKNLSVNYEVGK